MTDDKTEWETATTWAEMQFDAMSRHINGEMNRMNPAPSQDTVEMLRLLKERVDTFHQFWIDEIKSLRETQAVRGVGPSPTQNQRP